MIFVCLGNAGREYRNTRHNVGKMFGRYLVEGFRVTGYEFKKKNIGEIRKLKDDWQVIFLDCLMNNSGPLLQKVLKIRKLKVENCYVVHDDLDIPFGEFKIQHNRGAAGHKGVQSIIDALGTNDFGRIRIGISRPPENIPAEDYVLMHFTKEEKEKLENVFEKILVELKK